MVAPHFRNTRSLSQALNTVYTFCSAHKQLVPTFEMLKSSVESMTRRYVCALEASHPDSSTVEIEDVARIKSLCPELIHFAYIDSSSM